MKRSLPRDLAAEAPWALALFVLFAASRSPALAPDGLLPSPAAILLCGLGGALAALHRPLGGIRGRAGGRSAEASAERRTDGPTLGLGTLVLAPAVDRLGAVPAALVAGLAFLVAEMGRKLVERRSHSATGLGLAALLRGMAPVAVAALAAGAVLTRLDGAELALPGPSVWALRAALPFAAYALSFVLFAWWGLERGGLWAGGPARRRPGDGALRWRPLILDAGGWVLGLLLVEAAATLGWGRAGLLAAALALLAAEAARSAMLQHASDQRAQRLERMQRAHARILGETSDVEEIARQIFAECRRVLPAQWFQLELVADFGERSPGPSEAGTLPASWAAGPDGQVYRGQPRPPERPRTLPGIHRRAAWRLLERSLAAEGEILAVVRLWCDPRRMGPGGEELLSALVPQMTSSVDRARLERQAHLDPLTGVPLRRPFESALKRVYRQSCDAGQPMALILCDIDFFKRINDTFGHTAGDQALIAVAHSLDSERRQGDLCCRYGGEEFTLLLENTGGERALQLAERLRRAVEDLEVTFEGEPIPLTLSAGVAAFPEVHARSGSELLLLADEALYEAKERGRNRSLLHLGQGTFRTADGSALGSDAAPHHELPRIFG